MSPSAHSGCKRGSRLCPAQGRLVEQEVAGVVAEVVVSEPGLGASLSGSSTEVSEGTV